MKKFILCGASLIVLAITFNSCVKTCSCKEVEEDAVISTSEQPMVRGIQCEDLSSYSTSTDGKKTGTICE
jgi:hypothetical protein